MYTTPDFESMADEQIVKLAQDADGAALEYLERSTAENSLLHPETLKKLRFLLTMLRDRGEEETFRFIRQKVLRERKFPE
jgi:hypothetical protein